VPAGEETSGSEDANDVGTGEAEPGEEGPGDIEADDETLSVDPQDVLNNEDAAMPGEVTTSDVDKVISDIDKRFEQAEQELKAQFEEAEKEAPAVESLPGENDVSARGDVALPEDARSMDEPSVDELSDSSVSNTPALDGELGKTEVDELIEDAERRFEETQKRMQKQFEELEQEDVEPSSDALQPMSESDAVPQGSMDADAESQTP
jgi:polyhydroxyalkanoate synthesis regulator phasin